MKRLFLRYGFPLLALFMVAGAVSAQQVSQPSTSANPGALPAQSSATSANAGAVGEYAAAKSNAESISVTLTNASPTVVTMTANTFASRCQVAVGSAIKCALPIYFTGLAGSSGVSNNTAYWVDPASISGSTFKIATSAANALAGTDINTTGTDSGTGVAAAYVTTSPTAQAVAALTLTPGDWDCTAQDSFIGVASTAPTKISGDIATATTTINNNDSSVFSFNWTFTTGAVTNSFVTGVGEFLESSQTTIYQVAQITWTGGATNPTVKGQFRCRRVQ